MSLLLDVPYAAKNQMVKLGGKWDSKIKKWVISNKNNYYKFAHLLMDKLDGYIYILCDHMYIIEGLCKCYKCKKINKVIGFGVENYLLIHYTHTFEYFSGEINISASIKPIPYKLLNLVQRKYNFKSHYSNSENEIYLMNFCEHCNALIEDYYLFNEEDSPFSVDSREKAKTLKLYKIKLRYDLPVHLELNWRPNDYLIKKYGNIEQLNIII